MSGLEKAFHIHTWNCYSSQSLPTAACRMLWKSSHEALTLDYKLVLLLGVISKIHFLRKSYRVAALNKAMLYQRKERKQTKPWALNQMSYCVYHINLKLKNTHCNETQVSPLPEMQEGLLFLLPGGALPCNGCRTLPSFTLQSSPKHYGFPIPKYSNYLEKQEYTGWQSTIWLESETDFSRSWLCVWIMKIALVQNIR